MRYAFDTGYFFSLFGQPNDTVRSSWSDLREGSATGIVSGTVLFELKRHALVGRLSASDVDILIARAETAFRVVWMGSVSHAERVAGLAHGEGLSMADALVLAAALEANAARLYTGDRDLLALDGFESLEIADV
ncbi:MAG: VapC toxin family PIN domain ribonuclease [Bacteroidetes bacterium SW_9_63_38]|nr:MAG: VapC toxin family PIN domain ribonuclease [Bacteroidetes bacterium SW_9_63_38]